MIRWLPTSTYWSVFNTNRVESYGLESSLSYNKKINSNNFIKASIGYSYTQSVDLETQKQLMLVPHHKAFGNFDYEYSFLKIYVQGMFNGLTYTTSDEKKDTALQPYFVLNSGISATILKKIHLGIRVNNITNTLYRTSDAMFWMPKRNFTLHTSINF